MEITNITSLQRGLLEKFQAGKSKLRLSWHEARGALSSAHADDLLPTHAGNLRPTQPLASVEGAAGLRSRLAAFLDDDTAPLFGLTGAIWREQPFSTTTDNLNFVHHQLHQFVQPEGLEVAQGAIEVYGARLTAHFKSDGRLGAVRSSCYPEVRPANTVKTTAASLSASARESIRSLDGFADLEASMKGEPLFPLVQEPRLVIYPWQGKPIYAWMTYGYGALRTAAGRDEIEFGRMFFDAESGEMFLFAPTRSQAEVPALGTGLSSLPLGGPFAVRPLQVTRMTTTPNALLKDTTRARPIVTYDAGGDKKWERPAGAIVSGELPISMDTSGAANWNVIAPNTSDAARTAAQQPEVDAHATCGEIFDWYQAIGGRAGWDDNRYDPQRVPPQAINVVTHAYDTRSGTSRSANSSFRYALVDRKWVSFLELFDGDPTGTTEAGVAYDYIAGSKALIAHEYQHGVTNFSVMDIRGDPGLLNTGWDGAVQEGLSDVFAGLFTGAWLMGGEISPVGRLWRNLAFPPDTSALSSGKADHWDDRDIDAATDHPDPGYFRGCILAHAAYLMAEGGIHQRSSRSPNLIPVQGLGREIVGGRSVYKAALFWYRAVVDSLPTLGATTNTAVDEHKFRHIRDGCETAVINRYGAQSPEYRTVVLAWYAVGLHPVGTSYGADVTFVTWGADWLKSRCYVKDISCPYWSAPDLFINNGGNSDWNALINIVQSSGTTLFENDVYVRVRNIGDQQADNVVVQFHYAKIAGGASPVWRAMVDKNNTIQVLNVGSLGAGQSNFPDSAQDAPPAAARVKWFIPPLAPEEVVNRFRIRAIVACSNDVNRFNNEVQSDVAFKKFVPSPLIS